MAGQAWDHALDFYTVRVTPAYIGARAAIAIASILPVVRDLDGSPNIVSPTTLICLDLLALLGIVVGFVKALRWNIPDTTLFLADFDLSDEYAAHIPSFAPDW